MRDSSPIEGKAMKRRTSTKHAPHCWLQDGARVLFVSVTGIGNLLMLTPALSALKSAVPDIKITALVLGSAKDVLAHNSDVDEIILYPSNRNFLSRLRFLSKLRKNGYDACFYAYPNVSIMSAIFLFLITGNRRVNFEYPFLWWRKCRFLNSVSVPANPAQHDVEKNLSLIEACGIAINWKKSMQMRFNTTFEEKRAAQRLLRTRKRGETLIGFHMGANDRVKLWPTDNFIQVMERLLGHGKVRILIVGGAQEAKLIKYFRPRHPEKTIITIGKTSLGETAALIRECDLFVTNDSGPMHIAVAMGTRVVGIFLSSDVRRTAPYGDEHVIFAVKKDFYSKDSNKNHVYTHKITTDSVYRKIAELLGLRK